MQTQYVTVLKGRARGMKRPLAQQQACIKSACCLPQISAGPQVALLSVASQVRGRVVYFGPTGNGCIDYLRSINTSQLYSKDVSGTGNTAPAVPLLNAVQSQQLADGSVVSLNPAEWLVDLFTQADRDGRGADFADVYDASQLKQVCAELCSAPAS